MRQTMVMGGIVLVAIIVMLFTLPDMIGLEFTIAMSLTMSVLMGIYVVLVTEAIHRTSLAMIGALFIIIILIYTGLIPAYDTVDFVIGAIDFNSFDRRCFTHKIFIFSIYFCFKVCIVEY